MRIHDDHMYHGAALTQIAEHPAFTAINAFEDKGTKSRCAFRINTAIGAYIKYSSAPKGLSQPGRSRSEGRRSSTRFW